MLLIVPIAGGGGRFKVASVSGVPILERTLASPFAWPRRAQHRADILAALPRFAQDCNLYATILITLAEPTLTPAAYDGLSLVDLYRPLLQKICGMHPDASTSER